MVSLLVMIYNHNSKFGGVFMSKKVKVKSKPKLKTLGCSAHLYFLSV